MDYVDCLRYEKLWIMLTIDFLRYEKVWMMLTVDCLCYEKIVDLLELYAMKMLIDVMDTHSTIRVMSWNAYGTGMYFHVM